MLMNGPLVPYWSPYTVELTIGGYPTLMNGPSVVTQHWWTGQRQSPYTDELAISGHPTLINWPSVVALHWWTGQWWSPYTLISVHQFGSVVKHQAGKKMDVDSSLLPLTFLLSNCGLWTLSCDFAQNNNNETLNWLLPMPVWMQNHFGSDSVVLAITVT